MQEADPSTNTLYQGTSAKCHIRKINGKIMGMAIRRKVGLTRIVMLVMSKHVFK